MKTHFHVLCASLLLLASAVAEAQVPINPPNSCFNAKAQLAEARKIEKAFDNWTADYVRFKEDSSLDKDSRRFLMKNSLVKLKGYLHLLNRAQFSDEDSSLISTVETFVFEFEQGGVTAQTADFIMPKGLGNLQKRISVRLDEAPRLERERCGSKEEQERLRKYIEKEMSAGRN